MIDKNLIIKKIFIAEYGMIKNQAQVNLLGVIAEQKDTKEYFCSLRAKEKTTGLHRDFLDGTKTYRNFKECEGLFDMFFGALAGRNNRLTELQRELGVKNVMEQKLFETVIDIKATEYEDMVKEINASGIISIDEHGSASMVIPPSKSSDFRNLGGEVVERELTQAELNAMELNKWKGLIEEFGTKKTKDMLTKTMANNTNNVQKKTLEYIKAELFSKATKNKANE